MWNLPPPPGFQGLRQDQPIGGYVRNLPHWRQDGATYFVTFRLADSLPQSKLRELQAFKADWERRNPKPRSRGKMDELAKEVMRRVERWLDYGMGSCVLRDSMNAAAVVEKLRHFADTRYQLGCYVVMPNHVHADVRPLHPAEYPLEDLVGAWKSTSAAEINQRIRQSGRIWQDESFDRIIRDEEYLYRVIQYIGSNPGRAAIPLGACLLWINPEWVNCGWRFELVS